MAYDNIFRFNNKDDISIETVLKFIERHKTERVPLIKDNLNFLLQKNLDVDKRFVDEEKNGKFAGIRHKNNIAQIITNTQFNYLYGSGLKYYTNSKDNKTLEILQEIRREGDFEEKEGDFILQAGELGVSYILVYNVKDKIKMTILDPLQTFVIYSYNIEEEPIYGIRYYLDYEDKTNIEIFGINFRRIYKENEKGEYILIDERENPFKICQIIEHKNNKFGWSDFQPVKSHIDDINFTITTESNLIHYINNALLILKNLDADESDIRRMIKSGVVLIKSGLSGVESDMDFLDKPLNVEGVKQHLEMLLKSCFRDSFTPLISSDELKQAPSAKALESMYMQTDLISTQKEKQIRKTIRRILDVLFKIYNFSRLDKVVDYKEIDVQFTRSLPALASAELDDVIKIIQNIPLSDETKLELVPSKYIDNPQAELERLEKGRSLYNFVEEVDEDEQDN